MLNKAISSIGSCVNNYVIEPLKKSSVKTATIIGLTVISLSSCKKDVGNGSADFGNRSTSAADYPASTLPVTTVSGDISGTVHWDKNHVWELSGIVTLTSGTLTIDPGTFIKSTVNVAGSANGVLVIAKGASINAVGTTTPCEPIVFTSRYLLDGNNATVGTPGDFGGVIFLGNAQINTATGDALIEGLPDLPKFHYGNAATTFNTESSGTLKVVRIEYAGYKLADNIEVNGLTLGGIGSGTVIENVEVAWGLDDGFEFFGGKVSPKKLVALANDDDQYDFDLGYTGTITDAIAVAAKASTHSASGGNSDSNGAEIDNNPTLFTGAPKTHPNLVNFDIVGTADQVGITLPGFKNGVTIRRGGEFTLSNSIVTGYPRGIVFEANAPSGPSIIASTSIHGFLADTLVLSTTPPRFIFSGLTTSTASTAPAFGIAQPFHDPSPATLDFLGGARGAIRTSPRWTDCWVKWVYN